MESHSPLYSEVERLFDRLFPICRSITGPGFKKSLQILSEEIPFEVIHFPTGLQVYDWTVPQEWIIRKARLTGPDGKIYADFDVSNLAVLNFSVPVNKKLSLDELQAHLFSLPELPEAIPYVTSYYKPKWGFCLPDRIRRQLPQGDYHALIDAEHLDGELVCGHHILKGRSEREIVLTAYLCHPSLANNELSGPLVMWLLYRMLLEKKDRLYTYRFVLNPETIGSLCYLSRFGAELKEKMEAGLVLTCMGGPQSQLSYKGSRRGDSRMDRLMRALRFDKELSVRWRDFTPTGGSDERQFCSPGFNLPMGQIARTVYDEYEGYHNSLDTKEFMGIHRLIDSAEKIYRMLMCYERMGHYKNRFPYGELQLGKRGLYPTTNSRDTRDMSSDSTQDNRLLLNSILAVLNYSDGENDSIEIAEKMKYSPLVIETAIQTLSREQVLDRISE